MPDAIGDEQDAGQQVVDVRRPIPVSIAPPKHVDEQQHHGDRRDRGGDDRVGAAEDVAQRPPGEDGGVAEEVRGHRCSFLARVDARSCRSLVVADEGEEDVLEGRLLLDVLDLGGRQQLP